jgi:hypothetical protein
MHVASGVRNAAPIDVPHVAALAERKREQYRDHAAPFQRPAANARDAHEAFLPRLLEWDGFDVLVHDAGARIDGFLVARFGIAPPPFGEGSLFHVDDFAVASPKLWSSVGAALLTEIARRAGEARLETAVVVSGPAAVDAPKTRFLASMGLTRGAEWWVKPLEPDGSEPPEQMGFSAAVGPAPPVYDPGGLTCLALSIDSVAALEPFERYAAASQSVIAIVPTTTDRLELHRELERRGFTVASEWFTCSTAHLAAATAVE